MSKRKNVNDVWWPEVPLFIAVILLDLGANDPRGSQYTMDTVYGLRKHFVLEPTKMQIDTGQHSIVTNARGKKCAAMFITGIICKTAYFLIKPAVREPL